MASLVARALIEDPPQRGHHDTRRGIDRVLLATFWRPGPRDATRNVVSITERRPGAARTAPSRA
jgi:hypothetical protein